MPVSVVALTYAHAVALHNIVSWEKKKNLNGHGEVLSAGKAAKFEKNRIKSPKFMTSFTFSKAV